VVLTDTSANGRTADIARWNAMKPLGSPRLQNQAYAARLAAQSWSIWNFVT
jgi:hypothetical protein